MSTTYLILDCPACHKLAKLDVQQDTPEALIHCPDPECNEILLPECDYVDRVSA